jgi:hypothetical protein
MLTKLSGEGLDFKSEYTSGMGSLQRELLRNAWWCIYTNTVTGTIECKLKFLASPPFDSIL